MSNSTAKRLITGVMNLIGELKKLTFLKETGPKFIKGTRSGWSTKTKKGAQHVNKLIGKSAVGLRAQRYGVHWVKA